MQRLAPARLLALLSPFPLLLAGCGSNSPAPSFTVSAAPTALTVVNGGPAQPLTVTAGPVNGFNSPVSVSVTGLPAGVTASPATVSVKPGELGQILLSASGAAVTSGIPLTVTGSSGTTTQTATAALSITAAISTATISANSYNFAGNLVGNTVTSPVATVTNTGSSAITLGPALTGDPSFGLGTGANACGSTLPAGAACVIDVSYTPTTASGTTAQTATLNLGLGGVAPGTPQTIALSGTSAALAAGTVTATGNPQVALYTVNLPYPGAVTVKFGPDTTYGHTTWSQSTAIAGPVSMLVAGMRGNSTYHMQASIQFANGLSSTDSDHTFATQTPSVQPQLSVDPSTGLTPQPGLEQLTIINGPHYGLCITDLQGNVLWSYALPGATAGYTIEGAKLLANGHFMLSIGEGSSAPLSSSSAANPVMAIREIDLAGNIIREITPADLTGELAAAGYTQQLQQFHHDVTPLPNGHTLVLSNTLRPFTDLPGLPGLTNVLGDVVIDLDQNFQPVWVWDEFDHLDVTRHPYSFPDWTHTNAVVYSPDDGNLLVSMRHQNWVVKVDYKDGTGSGDILWRLGYQGDFTLAGGTDPTDWPYAQHFPSFFSSNTSGSFALGLMDNGDDRVFPAGVTCGTPGAPACLYTTIPIYQIDEGAKTATLIFHQILPGNLYSFFGGNTESMANGNVEYDLAGTPGVGQSDIFEVTRTTTPQTVWHMHLNNNAAYRGYRIPGLYPGVPY